MPLLHRFIFLLLASFLLAGFGSSKADLTEDPLNPKPVIEQFKLSRDSKCLVLPVEIKGKKYGFMLDTGASMTCYDKLLRSLLGKVVRTGKMRTPDGQKNVPLFFPIAAKLGSLDLSTKSFVLCDDFEPWRALLNEKIYGALGMDFLKRHILCIDYLRAEVSFLRSIGTEPGVRVPMTFNDYNLPQVEVAFAGVQDREKMIVDTGCVGISNGSLRAEMFDALVKRDTLTLTGHLGTLTISGIGSHPKGRVDSTTVGNCCHKNLLFSRAKSSALSLNFFSQYDMVTFDFPNKTIYLKKVRQFDRTGGEEPEYKNADGKGAKVSRSGQKRVEKMSGENGTPVTPVVPPGKIEPYPPVPIKR